MSARLLLDSRLPFAMVMYGALSSSRISLLSSIKLVRSIASSARLAREQRMAFHHGHGRDRQGNPNLVASVLNRDFPPSFKPADCSLTYLSVVVPVFVWYHEIGDETTAGICVVLLLRRTKTCRFSARQGKGSFEKEPITHPIFQRGSFDSQHKDQRREHPSRRQL